MEESSSKATFIRKKPLICPSCDSEVWIEELLTGRGRLIAGDYTIELRRTYIKSAKWGQLNPLFYPVIVCPKCYYSTYHEDFEKRIERREDIFVQLETKSKKEEIAVLFGGLPNFKEERNSIHGVLSYLFADVTYTYLDAKYVPTFKRALSLLRAAWLLDDYALYTGITIYNEAKDICYEQAAKLYLKVLELEEKGIEDLSKIPSFGPDVDKNFGFEGIKYVYCLLNYRLCFFEKDIVERAKKFKIAKALMAKVFGLGVSSKSKPSIILLLAKYLHKVIGDKIKEYQYKIDNNIPVSEDYIEIELFDLDKEESILKKL